MFKCWQKEKQPRILYAFDFDRTVIDDNSEDVYKFFMSTETTQSLIHNESIGHSWANLCQAILDQIIVKQGIKMDTILRKLGQIEYVPGMDRLLVRIYASLHKKVENKQKTGSHLIFISGSNQLFIESRLMSLNPPVLPDTIIANQLHATPGNATSLTYKPYEENTDCALCCSSLCKGRALEEYMDKYGPFDIVYYVGDGGNDVCPAQRLRFHDILFVRRGYQLEDHIQNGVFHDVPIFINAQIVYFSDGRELEEVMEIPTPTKKCCG